MGGSDGNSSSKGAENRNSIEFGGNRPKLSGEWSFKEQLAALRGRVDPQMDFAFREGFVKDVTDKQRQAGHTRLESAFSDVLKRPLTEREKRKAAKAATTAAAFKAIATGARPLPVKTPDELSAAELREDVMVLAKRLQSLRKDGRVSKDAADCLDILYELEQLPMTVACLKATKIAVELNQPCWKASVNSEVREHATSLVRQWRAMYRAEEGLPDGVTVAANTRRCRNLSMDLEEAVYSKVQKVAPYAELIQATCALLHCDVDSARSLLQGGVSSKDFVQRAARKLQLLATSRTSQAEGETRKRSIVNVY